MTSPTATRRPRRTIALLRAASLLVPLLAGCLLAGCRTALTPQTPQAPFFERGGQMQASASTISHLLQLSGAWSPVDNIGLIVTGAASPPSKSDRDKPLYHRYIGAMAGWYPTPSGDLRLELYGGAEAGWTGDYWWARGNNSWYMDNALGDTVLSKIHGSYLRYMAQLNIGAALRKVKDGALTGRAELGLALNASYIRFGRLDGTDSISPGRLEGTGPYPLSRREAFFIDPTLLVRIGTERIEWEVEVGTAHTGREVDFMWSAFHLGVGIRLHFATEGARDEAGSTPSCSQGDRRGARDPADLRRVQNRLRSRHRSDAAPHSTGRSAGRGLHRQPQLR